MQDVLILKNAVIFDGVNEEPLRGKSLVIADGKIDAICDGEAVCTGDVRIIDLDGAFVSPGFIDCHMHMLLDEVSRRNLELVQSLRDGGTDGTLFGVLNQTVTAMGARLLRHWIMTPLRSVAPIA